MTDLAVIMSIYKNDRLEFVRQSVQSILEQTFSDFHYYLIFDGPVAADVDSYVTSLNDERIRFFRLETNSGLAVALNYLLGKVMNNPDYKLIARMDADDISSTVRLETQYNFLKIHENISIVGSWYNEIDETGGIISNRKLPLSHAELKRRYYKKSPFPHSSVMYRNSLIDQVGYYPTDTIFMEDTVLWGKAIALGQKIANIPEFLLNYRLDANFFSRRSGLRYGWNFIKTKFKIYKSLNLPAYTYFISFFIGIVKMMPPFVLRYFYTLARHI